MDDYFEAIEARQGFIARRDVLEGGFDDRFIRRQRALRWWVRIRKGAYCLTSTWESLDELERHRRLSRAVLHSHGDAVALTRVSSLLVRPSCDVNSYGFPGNRARPEGAGQRPGRGQSPSSARRRTTYSSSSARTASSRGGATYSSSFFWYVAVARALVSRPPVRIHFS